MQGYPRDQSWDYCCLLCTNDLAEIKMFADDTSLYIEGENPETSANVLDSNLENVKKWAEKWLVDFNPGKSKSMTIWNKKAVHPPSLDM